jgi:hypothetical protein
MPNTIKINNNKYYNCADIINEHKKLFVCCKKSNCDIIKNMELKNKDYIFAYYNEKEKKWNIIVFVLSIGLITKVADHKSITISIKQLFIQEGGILLLIKISYIFFY